MKLLIAAVVLLFSSQQAFATPPPAPEYVALTKDNFAGLGFQYSFVKRQSGTFFTLEYPSEIDDGYLPYSIRIITRSADGIQRSRSTSGASPSYRHVEVIVDRQDADAAVSVTFLCKGDGVARCHGAREYSIPSILDFTKLSEAN
jgi:hypothetical protein